MNHPKHSHRLAAFYRAYEATHPIRPGKKTHDYRASVAEAWGRSVDLQPVPGPKAHPEEIEAWERRLEAVVSWNGGAA